MGIRGWLYWIDRALAGDRRPLTFFASWLFLVLVGTAAYLMTR